jgi:hypothetical protein
VIPVDHTKSCLMGYDLPLDRVPSDIDSRVGFTLGVWALARGFGRPTRLSVRTHPLLGDFWTLEDGPRRLTLQCWPHPQNPQQLLVLAVPPLG